MLCPCCSGRPFEQCCKPLIDGEKPADTPQSLMRSRYSAYCQKAIDYIYDTYAKPARVKQSKADIKAWADNVAFVDLEILDATDDSKDDEQFVTFCASYLENQQLNRLLERSRFVREQGLWRYIDGKITPQKPLSIGRNDPCPCKSGKKFKKCHGNR